LFQGAINRIGLRAIGKRLAYRRDGSEKGGVVGFMPGLGSGESGSTASFRLPKPSHPGRRMLNHGSERIG